MRASYEQIRAVGTLLLAIAPSAVPDVLSATRDLQLPFPCLADPDRVGFHLYAVGNSARSLGQRSARCPPAVSSAGLTSAGKGSMHRDGPG